MRAQDEWRWSKDDKHTCMLFVGETNEGGTTKTSNEWRWYNEDKQTYMLFCRDILWWYREDKRTYLLFCRGELLRRDKKALHDFGIKEESNKTLEVSNSTRQPYTKPFTRRPHTKPFTRRCWPHGRPNKQVLGVYAYYKKVMSSSHCINLGLLRRTNYAMTFKRKITTVCHQSRQKLRSYEMTYLQGPGIYNNHAFAILHSKHDFAGLHTTTMI